MNVQEILWEVLPKGEWNSERLAKIFRGYGWRSDELDEQRLSIIESELKPTDCYIGKNKFKGYVVYEFNWTSSVVVECPRYGNAIYVIDKNWREITKLSKWEARHSKGVHVIRHTDTWFFRLKEKLMRKITHVE